MAGSSVIWMRGVSSMRISGVLLITSYVSMPVSVNTCPLYLVRYNMPDTKTDPGAVECVGVQVGAPTVRLTPSCQRRGPARPGEITADATRRPTLAAHGLSR